MLYQLSHCAQRMQSVKLTYGEAAFWTAQSVKKDHFLSGFDCYYSVCS